jgi:hypothetical protein
MRQIVCGLGVWLLIGAMWLSGIAAPAWAQQPAPVSESSLTAALIATAPVLEEATRQVTAAEDAQIKAKIALRQAEREIPAPNSTDQARRARQEHIDALDRAASAAAALVQQRQAAQMQAVNAQRAANTNLQSFMTAHPSVRLPSTGPEFEKLKAIQQRLLDWDGRDVRGPRATAPLGGTGTPVFGGQPAVPGPSAWERYQREQKEQQHQLELARKRIEETRQRDVRNEDLARRERELDGRIAAHNSRKPNRGNFSSVESYNAAVGPYNAQAAQLNSEREALVAERARNRQP